jgi:hypothetical protein
LKHLRGVDFLIAFVQACRLWNKVGSSLQATKNYFHMRVVQRPVRSEGSKKGTGGKDTSTPGDSASLHPDWEIFLRATLEVALIGCILPSLSEAVRESLPDDLPAPQAARQFGYLRLSLLWSMIYNVGRSNYSSISVCNLGNFIHLQSDEMLQMWANPVPVLVNVMLYQTDQARRARLLEAVSEQSTQADLPLPPMQFKSFEQVVGYVETACLYPDERNMAALEVQCDNCCAV